MRMSDSIRLPRGRRDDYIIMASKYDSLEFKTNHSFVSSQTFSLVPHFRLLNKTFFYRILIGLRVNFQFKVETVFRIMERNLRILFWIQTSHSDYSAPDKN